MLKPDDMWYRADNTDYSSLKLKGRFTDDTVLTLAVADAILLHRKTGQPLEGLVIEQMRKYSNEYEYRDYGGSFRQWLTMSEPKPYNSYGNGAAMRVSPCAWLADTYEQAIEYAHIVTNVTHNHPDSIWSVEVVVTAIWLLRQTKDKGQTLDYISRKYSYDISKVENSGFQINSKEAVSLALKAVMKAQNFNEAIHRAVGYGGDTDTIAAITGSIAEAIYPIEPELIKQAEYFCGKDGIPSDSVETPLTDFSKAFTDWIEPKHQEYSYDIEVNTDTKKRNLDLIIGFILSFILFFIVFASAVKDLADYSSWNIVEQSIALLIVLIKLVGAAMSGLGAGKVIASFIVPDEEERTKGVVMFLAGITMIYIKFLLSSGAAPIQSIKPILVKGMII